MIQPSLLPAVHQCLIALESADRPEAFQYLTASAKTREFTPTQIDTAFDWLEQHALAQPLTGRTGREPRLLRALTVFLEEQEPLWLANVSELEMTPELLPLDAFAAGDAMGISPAATGRAVLSLARKFDATARAELGLAGETWLVARLSLDESVIVEHVSLFDDTAGYDIAVSKGQSTIHIEVKTTRNTSAPVIYVSRNEVNHLLQCDEAALAVVVMPFDQEPTFFEVARERVVPLLPVNVSARGRWESVQIHLEAADLCDPTQGAIAWSAPQLGSSVLDG